MYVNNLPFTETLQMAQRDMYDIDVMLLRPIKKMQKIAKRKKFLWKLLSGSEHAIGITFGILAAAEFYNQEYINGSLYIIPLTIGAATGFHSNSLSKQYDNNIKQLNEMITNTQNAINSSLPEQLHEIAEIVRQHNNSQR